MIVARGSLEISSTIFMIHCLLIYGVITYKKQLILKQTKFTNFVDIVEFPEAKMMTDEEAGW